MAKKEEESNGCFYFILILMAIGSYYYISNYTSFFGKNESTKSVSSSNQSNKNIPNIDEIEIDKEIIKKINESKLIELIGLNKKEKHIISIILSEKDPDIDNKSGAICSEDYKTCKWCSNSFSIYSEYMTIKDAINFILFTPIGGYGTVLLSVFDGGEEVRSTIKQYIRNYENGEKYSCETITNKEFCSEKCKYEYKTR
jgi:hypothetical protein